MTFPGSTMWPPLDLTQYERRFNRAYDTPQFPGVQRRVYKRQLGHTEANQPYVSSVQMQATHRSRVFAMMFSGDTDSFDLRISTSSGEDYFLPDPNEPDVYPPISTLAPGSVWMNDSFIGRKSATANVQKGIQAVPMLIEPNWELSANETLIFSTRFVPTETLLFPILNISIYVWQFPHYGEHTNQRGES